jgi:hypothetical protein
MEGCCEGSQGPPRTVELEIIIIIIINPVTEISFQAEPKSVNTDCNNHQSEVPVFTIQRNYLK